MNDLSSCENYAGNCRKECGEHEYCKECEYNDKEE